MQVSDGLYCLPLSVPALGQINVIHPAVVVHQGQATLVDTGYPGNVPLIQQALEQHGLTLNDVTAIILTHQDIDHIGSLPALLEAIPHPVAVLATEGEKPYIQGDKRLIKVTPESVERAMANLPASVSEEQRQAFRNRLENPPKAPVTALLEDGQVIGGLTVILTPGHTPGHMSLYHAASKTLLAADAMVVAENQLQGPIPAYCYDYPLARQSLNKFTGFDVNKVICYHGGAFADNVNQRIDELAAEAGNHA
ncbi:MBL fold metallo-hydrolase [Paenibacillus ferrarius]|uniref:MBL fold metallo-hydrolase n=1 Tax=Paenibacillus ferrarius TaxID=1469647 RepID=UPI003D2D4F28